MTDRPELWIILVFVSLLVVWAVIAARRRQPHLAVTLLGAWPATSKLDREQMLFTFHGLIHNTSSKDTMVQEVHFGFLNKRRTELIWEASNVDLHKSNLETKEVGKRIGPPLRLRGNRRLEFIATLKADNDVYQRYVGKGDYLLPIEGQEKPFYFQLFLVDNHGNCFTGGIHTEKPDTVNFPLMRHRNRLRQAMLVDNMYARPRSKHMLQFYAGSFWYKFKYLFRELLYVLGLR